MNTVGPAVRWWRSARSATVVRSKTSWIARATSPQKPCRPHRESAKHVWSVVRAEHRVELAFDRVRDLGHRDLRGRGQFRPRAPEALDQARLVQGAQLLFKESRDLLRLGDLPGGDEPTALPAHRQLDHRPHGVLELLRDLQHGLRPCRAI